MKVAQRRLAFSRKANAFPGTTISGFQPSTIRQILLWATTLPSMIKFALWGSSEQMNRFPNRNSPDFHNARHVNPKIWRVFLETVRVGAFIYLVALVIFGQATIT